ncbi:MAG: hypothetical protein KGH53_00295 [Candidatus Micrarchaeota archaeon]|nr:hypothetical protein [Candidatus Micrarchaeota archaeon]
MAISIFLAFLLAIVTTTSPASFNTASCYISPEFSCISSLFSTNAISSKFVVLFLNNVGQTIAFPSNALTVIPSFAGGGNYSGYCLPYNAMKGSTVTCTAIIGKKISQVGSQINPKFNINYELCSPNCAYPVVSTNTINTTGYATLQVSPNVKNPVNNVTLLTNPTTGQIFINGVGYPNNNLYIFLANYQYTIYGAPPNGYAFGNWVVSGGVSVGLSSAQSSTATTSSTGTLSANFVTTTSSTSTTTATTTSTSSTSTSSTSSTSTSSTSTTSTSTTSSTSTSTTSTSTTSTTSTSTTSSTTSTSSTSTTTTAIFYSVQSTVVASNIRNSNQGSMILEERFLAGSSMIGQTLTDVTLTTSAYTGGGSLSGTYQIQIRDSNNNVVASAPASAWNTGGAGTGPCSGVTPVKYIFTTQHTIVAGDSVVLDASNIPGSGAQQLTICGGNTAIPPNSGQRYCNSDTVSPVCPAYSSDNTGVAWYLGYN